MLIKIVSYFPAIVGLLVIGIFVYLNNPKIIKNKIFAALNLFTALWLVSLFIGDTTHSGSIALLSLRFGLFFSSIVFLFFYLFSLTFPFPSQFSRLRQLVISIPIIIIALTSFTTLQVVTVSIQYFGVQPEQVGAFYAISDFIGIAYLLMGIGILLMKYRKSSLNEKHQIKFVLFGLSVAIIVNVFTGLILTLLKIDTDVILLGSFSLFIFSLFVAYAIIKHGFLDIKLIVARTVAYLLSVSILVSIYAVIVLTISKLFFGGQEINLNRQMFYLVAAIILGLSGPKVKQYFDKLSNSLFYRDAYDGQALIDELNKTIVSTIELNKLLKSSAEILERNIKPEYCIFVLASEKEETFRVFGNVQKTFRKSDMDYVSRELPNFRQKVIVADFLEESDKELQARMRQNNVAILVQLTSDVGSEGIGAIVMGAKKSGNIYKSQDIKILEIVANSMIVAIDNALRFEEIQQFNITLEQKVDDATRRLRRANEKLIALDQTKDDFISMASHQLRTPLTSVKGYLSMLLEGDAGKVSSKQAKFIDQAFISSQRMVYMIADLLNVSRLKTGKFVMESVPTNLADVVEGEIAQLVETATARGLKLTYDKPKDFPVYMLDETKIRQVVMNFTDNAIHYTRSGGKVMVSLTETPTAVQFTVTDTGIGVPRSEQHNMFSKFFRANNARKLRPDGTGLGLFMAKKVVIAQGGSVQFKSTEGKGSIFGFTLPKSRLETPSTATEPQAELEAEATLQKS